MKRKVWQLQDAQNRFSEVIEHAIKGGPQTVTRHGKPTAVIISIEDYQQMCPNSKNCLLDWFQECPGDELSEILNERQKNKVRDIEL